jgi:hypothetical protein
MSRIDLFSILEENGLGSVAEDVVAQRARRVVERAQIRDYGLGSQPALDQQVEDAGNDRAGVGAPDVKCRIAAEEQA